uniref:S1 motif domain-containing protein n=2 Tax=Bursaphelenchus xylophilus TaxID=6326 RepID=A0A1I7RU02_BURXY
MDHQWKEGMYLFDVSEVGIHQAGHAMRIPDGNDGGGDLILPDETRPFLPVVVWDQRKKCQVHRVKGDIVKVFVSHLTLKLCLCEQFI